MGERTVADVKAEMAICTCHCGCIYQLENALSLESGHCFSCRHGIHYGRNEKRAQERASATLS